MKLVLVAGGTGGHFFPAVGFYEIIRTQRSTYKTVFITSCRQKGYHASMPENKFYFNAVGFSLRNPLGLISFLLYLVVNVVKSIKIFSRDTPHVIIGFGGYITAGPVIAAALMRIPCILHEQNIVPGKANRLFARLAKKVCVALDGSLEFWPRSVRNKIVFTGIPLRENVGKQSKLLQHDGAQELFTVLIIGGSQGTQIFVEWLDDMLSALDEIKKSIRFIHICGKTDINNVRRKYRAEKINAQCYDFYDEMWHIYSQCNMAICRAGASTLYELNVWQIPAVIIPYPFATDNHQLKNAKSMEYAGWYDVIEQDECSAIILAGKVQRFYTEFSKGTLICPEGCKKFPQNAGEKIIEVIENEVCSGRVNK